MLESKTLNQTTCWPNQVLPLVLAESVCQEENSAGVSHVMKHICSAVAAAVMLSPTVIPSLYPPPTDPASLMKWKLLLIIVSVVGVIAFVMQLFFQSRENTQRDRREQQRDERLEQMFAKLMQGLPSPEEEAERDKRFEQLAGTLIPKAPHTDLRSKVLGLANELFNFLRDKGPKPDVVLDKTKPLEEQIRHVMEVRGPYVEGVHYGYMAHLKDRVVKLFNELAEHGIHLPEGLKPWELDPPEVQNDERIRKIAENLFLIAARMDIAQAAKGT
jgi:hypothetical protein